MTISTCNTIYYGEQLGFIKENGNLFIPKIYFPYRYPVLTFLVSATPASIVDSSWVRFLCTRNDSYKPSGIEWDCWNVYYKRPVKQDSGNWAPVCKFVGRKSLALVHMEVTSVHSETPLTVPIIRQNWTCIDPMLPASVSYRFGSDTLPYICVY